MDKPNIAQTEPYGVNIKAGRYWWCRCGLSKKQPYCDGSHQVTSFEPMRVEIKRDGKYWFCGCKHTGKQPFCDGSHQALR